MASWPVTLPDMLLGLTDRRQDAVARSQVDAGPPLRRARFTAAARDLSVPMILTGAQRVIFDAFYADTLVQGSAAFDWDDPATDETVSLAFRSPPQWTLIRGNADPDRRVWQGSLELEVQP